MAWKDFDGAKKVYQSLLEHHPTHATARKNLDFLLEQTRGFPGFGQGERAMSRKAADNSSSKCGLVR